MNQKSSLRETLQSVSQALTANTHLDHGIVDVPAPGSPEIKR